MQDHERLIEKKRYELEHHPVQKQVRFPSCIDACLLSGLHLLCFELNTSKRAYI